MSKENILKEIIIGYRILIEERYQYKHLNNQDDFPKTIKEKHVIDIKNLFLSSKLDEKET